MAISRVPGYSLLSNLDRQGTDLSITSSGNTLIKFDVTNYRIGVNTTTPNEALEVNGNVKITGGNLITSGNLTYNLGSESNWWNRIYVGNVSASNFSAEFISGTLLTNTQPNITSLGNLTNLRVNGNVVSNGTITSNTGIITNSILPASNSSGNIGNVTLWYSQLYANSIYGQGIYGTILTGDQYNITNLGNVTVQSISVGGNILITGNTSGGIINADELYEANNRVLTEASNISVTGDVTGAGTYSNVPVTLVNSGVTSGTYGSNVSVAQITFDSKGRATSAANVTLNRVGNININNTTIATVSGDVVITSNIANANITGTVRATSINAAAVYDNNSRVLTENSNVQVSGDVSGYGTYSNINLVLSNTGVTPGVYGSADDEVADRVPKITVDSKGRITNIANVTLTQVGNVTFTDTTISTTSNITLAPANGFIFANNSIISSVADPVLAQDVVTLNYLNTQLSGSANVLIIDDSTLSLNDDGVNPSELELVLDGNVVANINAVNTNIYSANLNVGNFTISANTISSPGNIVIDAQSSGIVHIAGADAIWVPSGNSATRPLYAEEGYVRYNTDINLLEFYDGNTWTYPGAATISSDTIVPDGINDTYTLSTSTNSADGLLVSINGTLQRPSVAYTVVGDQITFIEVPQASDIIEVRYMAAGATTIKSLAYGTTKVELTDGNINVTGNVLPVANVTYDLGSETYQWRDLWLSGNTIHIGGAQISTISGALVFTPPGSSTPIDLSSGADPTAIFESNSRVKVTANYVNVAVNNTNVGVFSAAGLQVVGNVSATSFVGDGSQLTGLPASYANTNVAAYLTTYSGEIASVTTANTNMKGYVDNQITSLVNGSPSTLDTLNEIAIALGNDANLSVTLTNAIGNVSANVNTANTNMKGYVDGQISTTTSAITTANTNMKGYVDSTVGANVTTLGNRIDAANTAITTANTNMKGYVDGQVSGILDGTSFTGTVAIPTLTLTNALGINYGGTGGTSSSEALNNLLPSGEVSGYVLKTAGAGSYFWAAETGGGSTVGTQITTSRTYYTATSGQTVFTGLTYTPGAGQLRVYINGVRQFDASYTESNSSAFTLGAGVSTGTVVLAEVDAYTDFNAYANATYSSPVGSISSTTVQDALAELDVEKAALTGAAFTGLVSTTGRLTVSNSTQSSSSTTGALVVTGGAGIGGNVYIGGNLQVAGNVTYFSSNDLVINDALIYLADGNSGDVLDIGFISAFTDAVRYQHTGLVRDASDGTWKLFANVVSEPTTTVDFTNANYSNLRIGNLTSVGGTFTGNVSAGNVSTTNLSGTLTTAAQTNITSLGTLTGLTVSGAPVPNANATVNLGSTSAWWNILYANTHVGATATFTGNVTAGNVSATNLTGTLATASQTNITSLGTLTGLTVSGNVTAGGFSGTLLTASQPNITSVGTLSTLNISGLTTLAETTEILDTKSSVTGTVVHDFSTTAIWYYSNIAGNVTANITNVPTTNNRITSISIVINQGGTGYIVNGLQIDGAAQTIRWQGNTVPTAGTNRLDVFTFSLLRAANAWTVLGSATSHG